MESDFAEFIEIFKTFTNNNSQTSIVTIIMSILMLLLLLSKIYQLRCNDMREFTSAIKEFNENNKKIVIKDE